LQEIDFSYFVPDIGRFRSKSNGAPFTTSQVLVPTDSDGNGLNDDWEIQYFGRLGIDPNADPDKDGFTNYQEYLAGTDPLNPNSALRISATTPGVITFTAQTNKLYAVDYRDELMSGSWAILSNNILGAGSPVQILDPAAPTKQQRFYRVRLIQ